MYPFDNRPFRRLFTPEPEPNPWDNTEFGASTAGAQIASRPSPYRMSIDDMYGEGPALKAYQEHIKNIPVDAPSRGRRILAAIAGGLGGMHDVQTGIAAGQGVRERPYQQALANWQAKAEGLQQAAGIEGQRDAKRIAYYKLMQDAADKNRTETRLDRETQIKEYDAETNRQRNNLMFQFNTAKTQQERDRLQADINKWNADRESTRNNIIEQNKSRERVAGIAAGASRYGADRNYAGRVYATDNAKTGTGSGGKRWISSEEQGKAEDDVLREIQQDPTMSSFAPYIEARTKEQGGGIVINRSPSGRFNPFGYADLSDEDYQALKAEIESRVGKRLNKWSSFGGGDNEVDYDFDR